MGLFSDLDVNTVCVIEGKKNRLITRLKALSGSTIQEQELLSNLHVYFNKRGYGAIDRNLERRCLMATKICDALSEQRLELDKLFDLFSNDDVAAIRHGFSTQNFYNILHAAKANGALAKYEDENELSSLFKDFKAQKESLNANEEINDSYWLTKLIESIQGYIEKRDTLDASFKAEHDYISMLVPLLNINDYDKSFIQNDDVDMLLNYEAIKYFSPGLQAALSRGCKDLNISLDKPMSCTIS